jgi:hypothetical protein
MQEFVIDLDTGDCVASTRERLDALEQQLGIIKPTASTPPTSAAKNAAPRTRNRQPWIWKQRNWLFGAIATIAVVVVPHFAALEIDRHIDDRLETPLGSMKDDLKGIRSDIQKNIGDIRELKGIVSVLQVPAIASRLSKLPVAQLKSSQNELKKIKANLAAAPKDTPNLWPASFQVITLLSQAMYQLETVGRQPLSELNNISIKGFGRGGVMSGQNVLLKNTIEGWTFENSVIHFDASTKLVNVQFKNCVFIFPAEPNPPKSLQEIGTVLLASDLQTVKVTAG